MKIESSEHIGKIIRDGTAFDVKNWGKKGLKPDAILGSIQTLFALLEERKINYVLVGGVALLNYVEGRNTQDIDLLMAVSSLEKTPELKVSAREPFFARASFGELQIDILLDKNPLFNKVASDHVQKQKFLEHEIRVATVEGLLLLKLYALPSLYRQGNFARVGLYENDVATLLYAYPQKTDALVNELSKHVSENDLAEIKRILAEIEQRIQRFKQGTEQGGR